MTPKLWRCKMCGWANPEDGKKCISCNKPKPRAKKAPLPRLDAPTQCILLSLDTANTTGWCIRVCGAIVDHGEHRLYTDAGMACTHAIINNLVNLRNKTGLPIVAVSERSWGGHLGMGRTTAFGYWLHALRSIGVHMKRIIEVYPSTWRAVVLPPGMATAKRDIVRAAEMEAALAMVLPGTKLGHDEAPAIMIGAWAEKAGEVANALPNAPCTITLDALEKPPKLINLGAEACKMIYGDDGD